MPVQELQVTDYTSGDGETFDFVEKLSGQRIGCTGAFTVAKKAGQGGWQNEQKEQSLYLAVAKLQ